MSTEDNKTPDTPASKADDFVPETTPPTIEEVEAAQSQAKAQAPTKPAAEPAPAISEEAVNPFEKLASVVLESAELASRSATAATTTTAELKITAEQLKKTQQIGHKQALWMLIASASVMVITLLFFLIMGIRMNARVSQLDDTVLAVGKRAVELNVAMGTMDGLQGTLTELGPRIEAMAVASGQIETRIEAAIKQSAEMVSEVPNKTAQQVNTASEQLSKQVQGLDTQLKNQNTAVQNVTKELQAMRTVVRDVERLNREVQALISLQRERYLEVLRQNQSRVQPENNVQFPRRQADDATPPSAAGVANDGRIIVSPPRQ
jgi:hypothetical protein